MPDDISQLLVRWGRGDESALAELMPFVYSELRRLGRSALRGRQGETVLQPTALVHEAWLRLVGKQLSLESRAQFYALAAKLIRDILVDQSRRRRALKRGGSQIALSLSDADGSEQPRCLDFLIVDEALTHLAEIKPRYARIVELRCMTGLTIVETAAVLKISHATVEREWNFARLWLRRELREDRANRRSA